MSDTFDYNKYNPSHQNDEQLFKCVIGEVIPNESMSNEKQFEEQKPIITFDSDCHQKMKHISKIKRKVIVHPQLTKTLKKNGNMPKNIIGNFYRCLEDYFKHFESIDNFMSSKKDIEGWMQKRIDLNTAHLEILFGEKGNQIRNYENCKILRKMIAEQGMKMISGSTKIENCLSYLFCLEKYTSRLANPKITNRVQAR